VQRAAASNSTNLASGGQIGCVIDDRATVNVELPGLARGKPMGAIAREMRY